MGVPQSHGGRWGRLRAESRGRGRWSTAAIREHHRLVKRIRKRRYTHAEEQQRRLPYGRRSRSGHGHVVTNVPGQVEVFQAAHCQIEIDWIYTSTGTLTGPPNDPTPQSITLLRVFASDGFTKL